MWNGWLEDAEKRAFRKYLLRILTVKRLPMNEDENRMDMIDTILCEAERDATLSVESYTTLCVNAYAR